MTFRKISLSAFLVLIPFAVFAQGFRQSCWGNQIGFMGGGWMMLLWVILLIVAVVAITRWAGTPGRRHSVTDSAKSILAERYARGEISQEEYIAMKKQL
ncbi:MAG: SHOCT domain-containing protein [bacterium]